MKWGVKERDAMIEVDAFELTTPVSSHSRLTMREVREDIFEDVQLICDMLVTKFERRQNDVSPL